MNGLLKIRKGSPLLGLMPLKTFLYVLLLSDLIPIKEGDDTLAAHKRDTDELYELFPTFDNDEEDGHDFVEALNELAEEELLQFDEENRIICGNFQGKNFVPFGTKNSLFSRAYERLSTDLKGYTSSLGNFSKARGRYLVDTLGDLLDKGVSSFTGGDFNTLHSILYEIYTGGEVYTIRNKADGFQTTNLMKHYDRNTVFAIMVEAVLSYDKYRTKHTPNLCLMANMAEDVYRALIKTKTPGSKDYLREDIEEEGTF